LVLAGRYKTNSVEITGFEEETQLDERSPLLAFEETDNALLQGSIDLFLMDSP